YIYLHCSGDLRDLPSFPTRRSSDLPGMPIPAEITRITGITDSDVAGAPTFEQALPAIRAAFEGVDMAVAHNLAFDRSMLQYALRSEEHTSELQSRENLVCRLLLEKK